MSQKRKTCRYSISDWKRIRDTKTEGEWHEEKSHLMLRHFQTNILTSPSQTFTGTHFSFVSRTITILNSNNFQRISIRAYARFIINALCCLVMALFYPNPKHQLFSRGEGATQDSHPFKEDFFFELTSPGRVRAPTTTGLEFFCDRFVNVFMLDNHSREDFPYRRGD